MRVGMSKKLTCLVLSANKQVVSRGVKIERFYRRCLWYTPLRFFHRWIREIEELDGVVFTAAYEDLKGGIRMEVDTRYFLQSKIRLAM